MQDLPATPWLPWSMRDHNRPKQELINEVVALRKQVMDLREAMAARKRVEEALRTSEEQVRALADGSPVGLCLVRRDGTALVANRPFARMLGYDSAAELLRVGNVVGVFADQKERVRVIEDVVRTGRCSGAVAFGCKNGSYLSRWTIGTVCPDADAIDLVVVQESSAASGGDRHSA